MLEWLKTILGTVEGASALQDRIEQEIPKFFVSKTDFNARVATLRDTEAKVKTLEETIANSGDATQKLAALQAKYDTDTAALQAQVNQVKLDHAIEAELAKSGARNAKAVRGMLSMESVKFSDTGALEGLTQQLDDLKKNKDTAFLFSTQTPPRTGEPPKTGDPTPKPEPKNIGAEIAAERKKAEEQSNKALAKLFGDGN